MDFTRRGMLGPLPGVSQQSHSWLRTQTPASCANISLHNLFRGEIDLVVSIQNQSSSVIQVSSPSFSVLIRFLGLISGETHLVKSLAFRFATSVNLTNLKAHSPYRQEHWEVH